MSEASESIRKLRSEKKPDEAIKEGEALLAKSPNDFELATVVAEAYADKGDLKKAESIIGGLIKNDPKNKAHYLKRSVFRFKLEDREGALKDVLAARKIDPSDLNSIKAMVDVSASLGNYNGALAALDELEKKGNRIDPGIPERKRNLLRLVRMQEEADKYNILVDGARENAKTDSLLVAKKLIEMCDEKRGVEYYEVACTVYRKLGMIHEVVREASEAEKRKMTNTKVMRAYAFSLMDLQKNEEAIKVFDKAIALEKDDATLYADRSVAKMNSGEWKDALKDIDAAIKLNPHRDVFYVRKGDIVARLNGVAKAAEWYDAAIRENPLNTEARERKENVESILYKKAGEGDKALFR